MIVVDASAVVAVLSARRPSRQLVDRLAADGDLHAPHLLDVEVLHALRHMTARGVLSLDRAQDVRADFADLVVMRYPHAPLADRVWELRHNVTAYDGLFVALAEALGVPLISCDARLASAPGTVAAIELFAPTG